LGTLPPQLIWPIFTKAQNQGGLAIDIRMSSMACHSDTHINELLISHSPFCSVG
jgi:hypothetical protein